MEKDEKKLSEVYGDLLKITSPSGYSFTLREQTGEDDDILSRSSGSLDGTNSNLFIAGLVVDTDFTPSGKLTLKDTERLKLCDKYFLMISSRIFSLGQIVKFEYEWEDLNYPVSYEEDLGQFIWEYGTAKQFPEPGSEDYFRYRIKPHPHGKSLNKEFTISTGKKFRFDFINGLGEKYLMTMPELEQSKNAELVARDLRLFLDKDWVKVVNFKNFKAREMTEIREQIFSNDPILEIFSEVVNPKTGKKNLFPIVGTPNFFFP